MAFSHNTCFHFFSRFKREFKRLLYVIVILKLENFLLRWNPDAIVFNSSQLYGTPSYWVQRFFTESSAATVLETTLQTNISSSLIASAITWQNSTNFNTYLRIKVFFLIINSNFITQCFSRCPFQAKWLMM